MKNIGISNDYSGNERVDNQEQPAFAFLRGPDLTVDFANCAMISLLSLKTDDIFGRSVFEIVGFDNDFKSELAKCIDSSASAKIVRRQTIANRNLEFEFEPMLAGESVAGLMMRCKSPEKNGRELPMIESLLDNAPIGFAFFDREHRYVRINRHLSNVNGFPAAQHIGRKVEDLFPEIAKIVGPIIDEVFFTGNPKTGLNLHAESPTAPGINTSWTASFYPVKAEASEEIEFVGGFVVEITDHIEIQRRYQESEARFRSLAENSPDIIVRHGKDFKYLYVNQQIEKFTGINADDYIGKSYREMGFPEELASLFDTHLAEVFESKKAHDVEYQTPDGKNNVYSRLVPEFDANGDVASVLVLSTEISDRKNAELHLSYQKTLLETVTENTSLALFMLDNRQQCIYMNDAAENMTGFKLHEVQGNQLHNFIHHTHPDGTHFPLEDCPIDQALPKHRRTKGEETFIHRDGTFYPVAFTASPIIIDGKGLGTVLEVRETSEEKRRQLELQESNERFRTLAETLPQMVWTLTPEGCPDWASAQWAKYCGIENAVDAWSYMIHPDDRAHSEDAWAECIKEGKELYTEVRLRDKKGDYRYHSSVGIPVKDQNGKLIKWVGALTDIHDERSFADKLKREVAERTRDLEQKNLDLKNTEIFLETVLDSSVELVASFNLNLEYTFVNKRTEESLELDKSQIIGKHIFDITPSVEGTQLHADLLRGLNGERVHISKREVHNKPGTFIEHFIIPIHANGKVEGIVTLSRDISQIIQLTQQLQKMVYELQRSNEDLQQFAHVASHDLKEPVRKAMTFGSRLRDEFHDILPSKAKMYIEKMEGATGRMYDMIEGVLRYSSLSAVEQENDEIDLPELLGEIEADLELPLLQKGATISCGKLKNLRGSRLLIYQLFYNLINNALKFSKPNIPLSVVILSETADPEEVKHAGLNAYEPYIKVQVSDNGIGFSTDQAGRIFGTFTRLHPKDKYEGTGLGLALCKKIVERHKGAIYAKGKEGVGATFVVLIPA